MGLPNPLPQLRRLVAELRRRRVPHAVAAYAVVAWVAVQIAAVTFPALYLPRRAVALVVLVAVLGFPIVAVLSWAFELGPTGFRKTPDAAGPAAIGPAGRAFLVALVVATTGGLGWAGWQTWIEPRVDDGDGTAAAATPAWDPARIGVLYFDDHSPGDTLAHVADGLTEDLIHRLAGVEALDVISRHGVKAYRGGDVTLDSIARALGAGSLVEGSVQGVGGELEVTVQLIDGRTQTHLMSASLRRPAGDLFALKDSLSQTISRLLRQRLGRQLQLESWKSETRSVEAWDRLQRARVLTRDVERLIDEGDAETAHRVAARADSLLAAAEDLDPAWTRPLVLRARLRTAVVNLTAETWTEADRRRMEEGLAHADRAVEHDPDDPAARTARGTLRYWLARHTADPERSEALIAGAERDLQAAVGREAGRAEAWYALSRTLLQRGEPGEALYAARRAREADAFLTMSPSVYTSLFEAAVNRPDYDEAARWCRTGREEYPDAAAFRGCELILLASAGGPEPDPERARALAAEIRARAPAEQRAYWDAVARRQVAAVWVRAGREDSARAVLRRARSERSGPQLAYEDAHVLLLLGEEDEALERLATFVEAMPQYSGRLEDDPWFDTLRDHPRFRELIRR